MTKYIVKLPWHGVNKGDVIETDKLHPALLPNVEVLEERTLEAATPESEDAVKAEDLALEVATPKEKEKPKDK